MTWSDTEQSYDGAKKVAEVSAQWLEELGQEGLAESVSKAASAFDVMVNACKVAGVASAMIGAKNGIESGEIAALTAIKSALGPIGWTNIALAVAAGASAATVTGAICTYHLKKNLEEPSSVEAVKQFIGTVM